MYRAIEDVDIISLRDVTGDIRLACQTILKCIEGSNPTAASVRAVNLLVTS